MRFIPTCVGNSIWTLHPLPLETVHPHVCGELLLSGITAATMAGSSPRVWGTLFPWRFSIIIERFIPTCVGNSEVVGLIPGEVPVHPHVCGELSVSLFFIQ